MKKNESGFTLIELVTGVAIIALLSVVLSAIVVSAQRSAAVEKTRVDLVTENRRLIDETTRNIKNASSVLASSTVLGSPYITGSQTLILQLPAIDASQTLLAGVSDTLVFRQTGSNYEFIQDAGSGSVRPDTGSRIFSQRVTTLTFTYYDSGGTQLSGNYQNAQSVSVSVALSQTVRGQAISSTLADTATLRNK